MPSNLCKIILGASLMLILLYFVVVFLRETQYNAYLRESNNYLNQELNANHRSIQMFSENGNALLHDLNETIMSIKVKAVADEVEKEKAEDEIKHQDYMDKDKNERLGSLERVQEIREVVQKKYEAKQRYAER